jgi:hypothetical protein
MQLPENVQPVAAAIGKHHFWILAVLVPLLVVPMFVLANSDITKKIDDKQSTIQSKISAVQSVRSTTPHPNQAWADEISQQTLGIRQDTWRSWDQAYQEQMQIRVWPDSLGPQFLRYVDRLEPEGDLPLTLRELYQNSVPAIVRSLPARMGAEDLMESGMGGMGGMGGEGMMGSGGMGGMSRMMSGGSGMSGRRSSRGSSGMGGMGGEEGGFMGDMGPRPMVDWSPADQSRIYESFVWEKTPSTTQILLAQEELWIYGVLCDAIALANSRSTGHYNASIPTVEEMAIGYQAAEDQPGGEGTGRIRKPGSDDVAMSSGMGSSMGSSMEMMSMSMGGTTGAGGQGSGLVRPPHPRFGASGGGGGESSSMGMGMSSMGMMGGAGGGGSTASGDVDTELYNWIYVDFDGKPLTKSEIDSSPTNRMMRLMPFRLRIRIGEQKLDDFLVELATQAPVPIDVRQVRINPNAMGGGGDEGMMGSGGMGSGGMGGMGPSRAGRSGGGMGRMSSSMGGSEGMGTGMGMGGEDTGRPNDLDVEISGTIAIVAPPDVDVVGLAEDEIPQPDDQLPLDPVGPANTEEEPLLEGGVS